MIRLAALQMIARTGDPEANLTTIERGAEDAGSRGAGLLVAPELAITGYGAAERFADLAQGPGGPVADRLAGLARRTGVAIVCGFAERSGDAVFNAALLARPDAAPLVYRKSHVYGPYERSHFSAGAEHPRVTEVAGVKLGILICYDVEFPENVRHLALAGAEVVAAPTALAESPYADFIAGKIVPVRAFENQVAVVYANHAGADALYTYAGRSTIAMPDGTVAARAGVGRAEVIVADFEPSAYQESRERNPYLADRRTDLR